MNIDKSKMKDEKGRYIVQGLFLEDRYNENLAVYTLTGDHKEYNGNLYPSLKKLYLEESDPTEFLFAEKYCVDWPHWQRLCKNAIVGRHIEQWREELRLSLQAEGIATLIDLAVNQSSYQAAKWLADEGWIKDKRGRPSKEEVEGHLKKKAEEDAGFAEDYNILKLHEAKKK